ncbi:MAG: alpha/beta fold hydrolase [Pseudomonadales bacterium]|jgi:pimeloyl-ACP methyl ester carboxylesterase|nr:alpha/beta fold hydrolase [Pseudomonadales bacterium]
MADLRPPRPFAAVFESLTPLEFARLSLLWPRLARLPRGDGRPVLLFPGYSGDDGSTLALRFVLRGLGHDARGWGLGRNVGDVPTRIEAVAELVARKADELGEPVSLVGWSLGGYLAREAARERPEAVRRVVTLGSPIAGGPKYTQLAPLYRARGEDLDWIEAEVAKREAVPLRVPVTALYSRLDGIVHWRACVDDREAVTENVEVRTTHLGFGFSTEVFRILAERLAAPVPAAA